MSILIEQFKLKMERDPTEEECDHLLEELTAER
jgi:hypothetical protein